MKKGSLRANPLYESGSPSWARTNDLRINSPSLYRLSYRGSGTRNFTNFPTTRATETRDSVHRRGFRTHLFVDPLATLLEQETDTIPCLGEG